MAKDLEAPEVGQLLHGDCNDPTVQRSHVQAMLSIAKWADAATERINAAPEVTARVCEKVDELKKVLREQLVVREGQKEQILKLQIELDYLKKDLVTQRAWQEGHDTRQVRKEDIKDQRLWEMVKPMIQTGVPVVLALLGAHALGWLK